MRYQKVDQTYILKIDKGESFVDSVTKLCEQEDIKNAILSGIGAVEWVKCGYYELPTKTYHFKEYDEIVEVVNLTGNVMIKEDGLFVHAHGTFSNKENETFGGHIEDMRVGVTLEIMLTPLSSTIERTYDEEIGLYLLNI